MIQFENGKYFSYDMVGEFHSLGEWIHPKRSIKSFEVILALEGTVYISEENQEYWNRLRSITDIKRFRSRPPFTGSIFSPIWRFRLKAIAEPTSMK